MLASEDSDLFEVTCVNCGVTKTYFTEQGVVYFKTNHEGHEIKIVAPKGKAAALEEAKPEPKQAIPEPQPVKVVQVAPEAVAEEEPEPAPQRGLRLETLPGVVKVGNLVVDVVDDEKGRSVKVYGIAGGRERFSKDFVSTRLGELNSFLEDGHYFDEASGTNYSWTPDKIDLSVDVARLLDESPPPMAEAPVVDSVVPAPAPVVKVEEVALPEPPKVVAITQEQAPRLVESQSEAASDQVLVGKLSYIQPGEEYQKEALRVSSVLRKFRWNTEPPYVIGAIFDDLMSVQSQTGMIKAGAIETISKLGYTFVAIEAPSGTVTAWFRKKAEGEPDQDEPLEFSR